MEGRNTEENRGQIQVVNNTALAPSVQMQSVLDQIPSISEGTYDDIFERLLSATCATDLERPFMAGNLEDYLDRWISVTHVKQAPSDFQSGAGVYLVLDIIDEETTEMSTITTGSVSVVAQVAIAFVKDLLPLTCMPTKSAKATKNGFYPYQLKIHPQQHRRRAQITVPSEENPDDEMPF